MSTLEKFVLFIVIISSAIFQNHQFLIKQSKADQVVSNPNNIKIRSFNYRQALLEKYTKEDGFYLKLKVIHFVNNKKFMMVSIHDSPDETVLIALLQKPDFIVGDTVFVTAGYLGTQEYNTVLGPVNFPVMARAGSAGLGHQLHPTH